jgi:molybdopterin converting factor small subunit
MKITVKLFATLRIGRFKQDQRDYPVGATCQQVAADLGVGREETGMVLVNGRHASLKQVLNDGDSLSLFPLLGGG